MKIFSPENRIRRRMGYLTDQEGIINRYMAEREGWDLHLENTRNFIRRYIQDCRAKTIAVFGSGWLLDLPLEDLAERFDRILLLDIHHPPQVREKLSAYPHILLQETDLSGGAVAFAWSAVQKGPGSSLPELHPERPALLFEPEAFISLNILNQLDILPADFLKEKLGLAEEQLLPFRRQVQLFHIDWITSRTACLISDTTEISTDREGQSSRQDLVHVPLPPGKRSESWEWVFDTRERYREGVRTSMQVRAVEW